MERIEFVNDLCCNYLTIPYEGEEHDFALRMMRENVTDIFLEVELRRMDEEIFLYYRISGMQSMEILYAEKPIDRGVFQTFMWQLHEAVEQSMELFLPGDGICLDPSILFWDLGEERWKFIYIPGQGERQAEEIQSEREKLAEFLAVHMDYEDRELSESIYRFYEEVCEGRLSPGFWEEKFLSESAWQAEKIEEREAEEEIYKEDWDQEESEEEPYREVKSEGTHSRKKGPAVLCGLLCAAVAATLAVGRIMPDMIMVGTGVSVLLAVFLSAALIRRKDKDESVEYEPADRNSGEPGDDFGYINNRIGKEYEEREYPAEEKTVYMDMGEMQERKLYGVGKFRRQRILLDQLPCLVGKDKTLVNHIIEDVSVSRMHARFFAEEEKIWMQDLNSTNGTYHNGMRLSPNERVILEPEDEIGFGQAQFVFR